MPSIRFPKSSPHATIRLVRPPAPDALSEKTRGPARRPSSSPRACVALTTCKEVAMTLATEHAPTVKPPKVRQTKILINGKWVDAESGRTFETINPATGDVIARVAEGEKA